MRIVVICIGRLKGPPFADDVAHYERLLSRHVRLEIQELREAGTDQASRDQALASEGEAVLARLPRDSFVCALDRQGVQRTSLGIADFLEERRQSGRDLCMVVGGPFGLSPAVLDAADERLSFGAITLPHQLARVVLLEQLFRAHKILAREPYHY